MISRRVSLWLTLLLIGACAAGDRNPTDDGNDGGDSSPGRILHTQWSTRAVRAGVTDAATLEVHMAGRGSLALLIGDQAQPLNSAGGGRYTITLPRATLLRSYAEGDLHAFVGYLVLSTAAAPDVRYNMFVNVVDGTVPAAPVTALAADARATAHVLNIRVADTADATRAAVLRLYQLYPDAFDFIAVVRQVVRFQNRAYQAVRNGTSGLGLASLDAGAAFGSQSRLQGIVHYPIDTLFDLGETAATHEIGHRWLVFLRNFTGNSGHWPMSDLALGPMGFAIPGSGGEGGSFPRELVPQPDGTFRIACVAVRRTLADLELYLMGLLPPDSVEDHFIITGQTAMPACNSVVSATKLTIGDVIAANGPRVPAAGADRRDFRIATIVLSLGRFLNQDEMDFFDHLAARGEAREPLHYTSGLVTGTTLPFYLATGGRATLTTRLQ